MEKDIWKRILEEMPDEELCAMANFCSLKVQGFRQITIDNLKMCKPRLILGAVKPRTFSKVKLYFDALSEPDEDSNG